MCIPYPDTDYPGLLTLLLIGYALSGSRVPTQEIGIGMLWVFAEFSSCTSSVEFGCDLLITTEVPYEPWCASRLSVIPAPAPAQLILPYIHTSTHLLFLWCNVILVL